MANFMCYNVDTFKMSAFVDSAATGDCAHASDWSQTYYKKVMSTISKKIVSLFYFG